MICLLNLIRHVMMTCKLFLLLYVNLGCAPANLGDMFVLLQQRSLFKRVARRVVPLS